MILEIRAPTTIVTKPKGYKKYFQPGTFKKFLFKTQTVYLDTYFRDSLFSNSAAINSYYGGGLINIGTTCLIMGTVNIEGPEGKVIIGNKTFIGGNTQINCINSISIGNNVLIAANCTIQDHNSHSINYLERRNDIDLSTARFKGTPKMDKDFSAIKSMPVIIEDDAWIGQSVFILKGVTIGKRAIVAAGSIVTKDVEADCVVAGNPAIVVRSLNR